MTMFRTCVNAKVAVHFIAEFVFGEHALDSKLDRATWVAVHELGHRQSALTTRVTGVPHVLLLRPFLAGKADFLCVDHDHIVTAVHVGAVGWLVLATQDVGNLAAKTAQDLAFGVNDEPLFFHSLRLCVLGLITERIHLNTSNSV